MDKYFGVAQDSTIHMQNSGISTVSVTLLGSLLPLFKAQLTACPLLKKLAHYRGRTVNDAFRVIFHFDRRQLGEMLAIEISLVLRVEVVGLFELRVSCLLLSLNWFPHLIHVATSNGARAFIAATLVYVISFWTAAIVALSAPSAHPRATMLWTYVWRQAGFTPE